MTRSNLRTLAVCVVILVSSSLGSPTGKARSTVEVRNFKAYLECRNPEDCPTNHCCTLGMQRYSVPICSPFGVEDDSCIPHNPSPQNFSLSYPNARALVEVTDAYLLFCPCKTLYSCHRDSNSCQKHGTSKSDSSLIDNQKNSNFVFKLD